MAAADLAQIPDVDIDPDGVFKYVLIRVRAAAPSEAPAGESKDIVRGYKWAEYHADIYDKVSGEMQKKGYDCECLGGGRISHQSQDKKIHVYGYSMARAQSTELHQSGETGPFFSTWNSTGLGLKGPTMRDLVVPSTPSPPRRSRPHTLTTRSRGPTTATESP